MLLANVVLVILTIGACVPLTLDSTPAKAVRYAYARWRHRRKVGASSYDEHQHVVRYRTRPDRA